MPQQLNAKRRKTLEAIYERPTRSNIRWSDIKGLLLALGGEVRQGRGSREIVKICGIRYRYHAPHTKETPKYIVDDIRSLLEKLEVIL